MDPDIKVRVALDTDPDDPAPVYTDITSRVHYGDGGQAVTVDIGRQNETDEIKPTELGWAVKNSDGRFTPRNVASPYTGKWEQGRRCWITETVGGIEFDLGQGFLSIPDMPIVDPLSSQPVTVTAIDRMGRLDSAPPYDGVLAEHIRTQGGQLAEWYPLSDPGIDGQYMSNVTGQVTQRITQGWGTAPITADPDELIIPADLAGPPGDDQSYARFAPVGDVGGLSQFADARLVAPIAVTAGVTDTIAVSAWVRLGTYDMAPTSSEPQGWTVMLLDNATGVTALLSLQKVNDGAGGWVNGAGVYHPGLSPAPTQYVHVGRPYERDEWRLVTTRWNLGSGLHEVYAGADATASQTVAAAGPITFKFLGVGLAWSGGIAHVQVRVGSAASTMTRQMHLDQYAHGYRGLHRQTVAERIVTLAGYAGIPATEVSVPAACSTPMQVAKLAGVNPAAALRATAASGQDLLITDGRGRITAVPRGQRYNQAVAMQIPFGWITRRGLKYRPDRPVTDVTVSRTGGGQTRRTDRARASRYGVTAQPYTLDSAIDADAGNLTSWALSAFGQMRTRCPNLRINMLRRSTAERQALLGLRVGDRIQLTGLPAGSPDDVPHLIVQGVRHTIGPGLIRVIEFNTSPLLGPTPGVPPACPMVGDLVSTTAIVAY